MKTPERLNNAIKALIQGFFDETLIKGDCHYCAVGNILNGSPEWSVLFYTNSAGIQVLDRVGCSFEQRVEAVTLCSLSGYHPKALAEVEFVFETTTKIHHDDYHQFSKEAIVQDQYNGLMAVVEVLCEIEGIDTKEYKEEFEYILNGDILEKVSEAIKQATS